MGLQGRFGPPLFSSPKAWQDSLPGGPGGPGPMQPIVPGQGGVPSPIGPGDVGGNGGGGGLFGGLGDRFRDITGFLGRHKNDILDYGSAIEGLLSKRRRNKLEDEALAAARADYARRAPLREQSMNVLMDDSRPDLTSVFADPNDPNGRYRMVNVGSRGRA